MKFLKWATNSRKAKTALVGFAIALMIRVFHVGEEDAAAIANAAVILTSVIIAGIAVEDGAAKLNGKKSDE